MTRPEHVTSSEVTQVGSVEEAKDQVGRLGKHSVSAIASNKQKGAVALAITIIAVTAAVFGMHHVATVLYAGGGTALLFGGTVFILQTEAVVSARKDFAAAKEAIRELAVKHGWTEAELRSLVVATVTRWTPDDVDGLVKPALKGVSWPAAEPLSFDLWLRLASPERLESLISRLH